MAAEGQIRAMDKAFDVDGEKLDYPRDPSASPRNRVNCQCVLQPLMRTMTSGKLSKLQGVNLDKTADKKHDGGLRKAIKALDDFVTGSMFRNKVKPVRIKQNPRLTANETRYISTTRGGTLEVGKKTNKKAYQKGYTRHVISQAIKQKQANEFLKELDNRGVKYFKDAVIEADKVARRHKRSRGSSVWKRALAVETMRILTEKNLGKFKPQSGKWDKNELSAIKLVARHYWTGVRPETE